MAIRKTSRNEDGSSLLDALVALILITIIVGGGVLLLGRLPDQLLSRIKIERDRWRFVLLWKECRALAADIRPAWWSGGPRIIDEEGFLDIRAGVGISDTALILQAEEDGIIQIGNHERIKQYRFSTAPTWSIKHGDNAEPIGLRLELADGPEAEVFFGGRPLKPPVLTMDDVR